MQEQFSINMLIFFPEKLFEKDGRITYDYTLLQTEILH